MSGPGTPGREAEERVVDALRRALDPPWRLYPNARWLGRTGAGRALRDGEADLVLAHPEHGFLVLEVKSGPISRDAQGRWWSGSTQHVPGPAEQAEQNKHALVAKLRDLPDWPAGLEPLAGHAVAFPDVELASAGHARLLGPDLEARLVLDRDALRTPESVRVWVAGAFAAWEQGQHRRAPLGAAGIACLDALLAPVTALRPLLRGDIAEAEPEVVTLTQAQYRVLDGLRSSRRQEIAGCAGSGKTLLAAEKARRLAREGYRTLVVCFNQPLARELAGHLRPDITATGRLEVTTFHHLCERLAAEAGVLPPAPAALDRPWFEETLPAALDAAIPSLGGRYQAVVVDEGQDFTRGWLDSLQLLLADPSDVFYVFHDPAQAIYRPDVVASLDLPRFELVEDCRSAGPIHALAARFGQVDPAVVALRPEGRQPELIEAEPGRPTLEALRKLLHRLVVEEGLRPWEIAVLVGVALRHSEVWRTRVFGNQVLWNGSVDDAGVGLGLAAEEVPEQPTDTILCETVHRSKGLDWPCVVLVELRPDDPRLDPLLYVGISRARHHVVVIGSQGLLARLR